VDIATQMDAANDQNAQLRDLNSKFIKELRAARRANGDTVAAAEKHREAADAMVRVLESSPSHHSYSRIHPVIIEYPNTTQIVPPHH